MFGSHLRANFCLKLLITCIILTMLKGFIVANAQEQSDEHPPEEKKSYGIASIVFSPDGKLVALVKGSLQPGRYYGHSAYEGSVNYTSRIEVWSLSDGKLIRTFSDFVGPVPSVCFSPDGNHIATTNWELKDSRPLPKRPRFYSLRSVVFNPASAVLKVWDIKTGEMKWSRKNEHSDITAIAYSPDGNSLLAAQTKALDFADVNIYDSQAGTLKRTINYRAPVGAIAFSPDGKTLAVRKIILSETRCELKIYDFPDLREQRIIQEPKGVRPAPEVFSDTDTLSYRKDDIKNLVFSPDSKKLAIHVAGLRGKDDELVNQIITYDAQTGNQEQLISVSRNPLPPLKGSLYQKYRALARITKLNAQLVSTILYLANGSRIGMLNRDGVMKIWDVKTGEEVWTGQNDKPATSVAFMPGGELVAFADYNDAMTIWDGKTGQMKLTIKNPIEDRNTIDVGSLMVSIEPVLSLAFSADGYALASAGGSNTVRVWDVRAAVEKSKISRRNAAFTSVAFSPDGKTIATGNRDGDVTVWNAEKNEQLISTDGEAPINAIAFSIDGNAIAAASADGGVKLWEAQTGKLKLSFDGHSDDALCVAFSPDGKVLASASADGTIAMWNAQTGALMRSMRHAAGINSIAFSPDGKVLASGSVDKTVQLWNAETGELKKVLKDHDDAINAVAFSPDGMMLATGGDDKTVRLWNAQTGKSLRTLKGHDESVHTLAFSPDGSTLAVGTGNNVIAFWNPQSGEFKRLLKESVRLPTRTR